MERRRNPESIFGQYWRCGWRGAVQPMALYLVIALLAMTVAVGLTRPGAPAHLSEVLTREQALVFAREVQGRGEPHLSPQRAVAPAHIIRMTQATQLSTGAGGGCHASDISVTVQQGSTLSGIAAHYSLAWPFLASYNHLTDPNLIFQGQILCVPGSTSSNTHVTGGPVTFVSHPPATVPQIGRVNLFPDGQCTWWANQRFFQLHGVYVPWTLQSDAWQWTARARDFGWQVSATPQIGDIVDLQPWVQGAYGLGHVAVVERILGNGDVLASNMNWGTTPGMVVNVEFTPGAGVTFIRP